MASSSSLGLGQQAPLSEFASLNLNLSDSESPKEPSELAAQRIADAQALFGAKPSLEIFKRSWSPDAIFEDPIAHCRGWRQYAAQWWGMKVFSTSVTKAWRITKDTPQEIQFAQKQHYGIKRFGFEKTMISTVTMKLDNDGRIIHFQDAWDGKPMPGFWATPFRRANALSLPFFMSAPAQHPDQGGTTQESHKDL